MSGKIVKSIETKPGGKSGTYWAVTWDDDKKDNIFNKDWLPLLEKSHKESVPILFTKEKKGDFWNIVSLEFPAAGSKVQEAAQPIPLVVKPGETKGVIAPQERGMWWKEMGECFRVGLIKKDDNGTGTYLWKTYLKQMLSSLEITIEIEKGDK